jgi:hypothetical protein
MAKRRVMLRNPVTGFTCKLPVTVPNIIQWAQSKGYEIVSEIQEPTQPTAEQLESVEYWRERFHSLNEAYIEKSTLYVDTYDQAYTLQRELDKAQSALRAILELRNDLTWDKQSHEWQSPLFRAQQIARKGLGEGQNKL